MSVVSTVRRGRHRAQTLMIDTCVITRPGSGDAVWDDDTQQSIPPASTTVYTGRCSVRARQVGDLVQQVAGQAVSLMSYTVSVPWDTTGVVVGDLVAIITANDPGEVGRELVVESVAAATTATQRRFICSHNQG